MHLYNPGDLCCMSESCSDKEARRKDSFRMVKAYLDLF